MMIFVNEVTRTELRPRQLLEPFVLLVAPFAPHIAEELWEKLGHPESLARAPWPAFDPAQLVRTSVEVVIQVNGKVRSKITVGVDTPDERLESLALADAAVQRQMEGKHLAKTIVVKNKLVNLVVR
jgi:leucyl-tRNA synthetase